MLYNVASSFVKIDEKQGIIQNASSGNSIEVSDEATTDSGIILKPGESLSFTDTDIYVRTIGNKTSAVRVVPFVQGFTALSDSNSSSSEEFVASYTSILINSTTPEGKPKQEVISYVNPNKTKNELCTFGQLLTESTVNTYKNTYRIDKVLCDRPSSSAYDKYLIADSPFDEDFTDNCDLTWQPTDTVTVSDAAAQFSNSYLRSNEQVTFGGQDFTISFDFYMNSSSTSYAAPFAAQISPTQKNKAGLLVICRYQSNSSFVLYIVNSNDNSVIDKVVTPTGLLNAWHNFELDYSHDDSTLRLFVDGTQACAETCTLERLDRYLFLGVNPWNGERMTGSLRNLKIYDDVAIHTEDFTLE